MMKTRILAWGTADLGKPRTRILLDGLRRRNALAGECLCDVWRGVEDKSQVRGVVRRAQLALTYVAAYPGLIWRYLRAPRHDAVFIAYMGHFDVLVLWPFAKMRGAKIIWDAFLSLYDTVVEDRRLVRRKSPLALAIGAMERLSCAAADVIVLDTKAHADYFQQRYNIAPEKLTSVWVGAETDVFRPARSEKPAADDDAYHVLFYGQFIPLHGVDYIVDAARRTDDSSVRWTIIGDGQEADRIQRLVDCDPIPSLRRVKWVDYRDLPARIAAADLCLGVFGESDKAKRVIPNKVFQILAVGRPLVTMDSPAIRELLTPDTPGVWLVEPKSGAAIAQAVAAAKRRRKAVGDGDLYAGVRNKISPEAIGAALLASIAKAI